MCKQVKLDYDKTRHHTTDTNSAFLLKMDIYDMSMWYIFSIFLQAHSTHNVLHDLDLSQATTEFALQVMLH